MASHSSMRAGKSLGRVGACLLGTFCTDIGAHIEIQATIRDDSSDRRSAGKKCGPLAKDSGPEGMRLVKRILDLSTDVLAYLGGRPTMDSLAALSFSKTQASPGIFLRSSLLSLPRVTI